MSVTLFTLLGALFFVCLLVKYPTPPKRPRLEQAKKMPSLATTSNTSMESPECNSGSSEH